MAMGTSKDTRKIKRNKGSSASGKTGFEFEPFSFVAGDPKMQSVTFSLVFVVIVGVVGLGQGLDLGSRQSSSRRKMESPATNKVWP